MEGGYAWPLSQEAGPRFTSAPFREPWRLTRCSLSSQPYHEGNTTLVPQLEKTHEMPLSSRDEGLLFLHGLERRKDPRVPHTARRGA